MHFLSLDIFQTLNRNSFVENEPVKGFFTSLINGCMTCGRSSRLDLLACSSIATDAAEVIAKDLTSYTGVGISLRFHCVVLASFYFDAFQLKSTK